MGNHGLKFCLPHLPLVPVLHRPGAADSTGCFMHKNSGILEIIGSHCLSGIIKTNLNPGIQLRLSHLFKCHCKSSTLGYQAALAWTVLHFPAGALTSHSSAFSMRRENRTERCNPTKKLLLITNKLCIICNRIQSIFLLLPSEESRCTHRFCWEG